jgi:hypothetical protein
MSTPVTPIFFHLKMDPATKYTTATEKNLPHVSEMKKPVQGTVAYIMRKIEPPLSFLWVTGHPALDWITVCCVQRVKWRPRRKRERERAHLK